MPSLVNSGGICRLIGLALTPNTEIMNVKYFGNSLDLMKYDVLLYLLTGQKNLLFYIPMLTKDESKALDPKYILYGIGRRNKKLYELLSSAYEEEKPDFGKIVDHFNGMGVIQKVVLPLGMNNKDAIHIDNIGYFSEDNRERYFKQSASMIKSAKEGKLIFIDPDVGLSINIRRRVRSKKTAYLMLKELKQCVSVSNSDDIICFFQHLGNHHYSLKDRISDLKSEFGELVFIVGNKQILGSLIFIFNCKEQHDRIKEKLERYLEDYRKEKYKDQIILQ